jgi:molecular chaperone GrpE (heat shock protein)
MRILKSKNPYFLPVIVILSVIVFGAITYFVFSPNSNKAPKKTESFVQSTSIETKKNNKSDSLMVAFFVVVLILLSISIFTNILLFKWRIRTNDDQVSIVPEELLSVLNFQLDNYIQMKNQLSNNIDQSIKDGKTTKKLFADLMEAFTVLQTELTNRDKEIQRLKKGYDLEIFRKFLVRFIRTDDALSHEVQAAKLEKNDYYQNFEEIQELLRDAFDECGVSSFSPNIGTSIRNEFGVDDNYGTLPARSKEEEHTIAEVIEPGFKIQTPNGPVCIKPAKVTVYIPKKGD